MKRLALICLILFPLVVLAQAPSASPVASATPLPTVVVPCETLALDPVFVPPAWLQTAILFVKSLPVVGPILVEVGKWAGVLAAFLTSVAIFLIGVLRAAQPLSKLAFVGPVVTKILEYLGKALPYIQYLSMFNVQKAEEKSKS